MSDRFRMSDSASVYALLILAAAIIAVLILAGAAVVHWLL
jgi:hypothetical protein